jgi:hypothetical protein
MLFHPEKPDVIGILDWELATLGHPLADLGFSCIPWRSSPDEYGGLLGLDQLGLGIPTEAEYVSRYYERAVPTSHLLPFHVVFALFRFAVISVSRTAQNPAPPFRRMLPRSDRSPGDSPSERWRRQRQLRDQHITKGKPVTARWGRHNNDAGKSDSGAES